MPTKNWLLRDRLIHRPGLLVAVASVIGPIVPALVFVGPFVLGKQSAVIPAPLDVAINVVLLCLGGYFFGLLPAFLASLILALRRNITVLEAVVAALGTSFIVGTLYGMAGLSSTPLYTGTSLALMSIPATLVVGLLAAWWGVFAPPLTMATPVGS